MKKLLIILLLIPFITFGQEYNKWSIEPSYGLTKVRDITSVEHGNFDIGVRKMFNTKFGARLNYSYTESIEDYHSGYLQGITNIGRVLEFEEGFTKNYTILLGIGGHFSNFNEASNSSILHRDSNFHLTGTIDNLIKISNRLSIALSLNVITGVNSRPFNPGSTQTTSIINFNTKVMFYLGKQKEHADWILLDKPKDSIYIDRTKIINNSPVYNINSGCDCSVYEYVFFDNDSYMLDKSELNAIMKIYRYMELNPTSTLTIKGYASNTKGTSEDYDLDLSQSRSAVIHSKLVSLGIEIERVKFKFYGKDYTKNFTNHDIARRVELLIN